MIGLAASPLLVPLVACLDEIPEGVSWRSYMGGDPGVKIHRPLKTVDRSEHVIYMA